MRVIPGPSLRERTTLRLGGRARAELWIEEDRDWEQLPVLVRQFGGVPMALGQGSNVLALDSELPVVLIRQNNRPPEFAATRKGATGLIHGGQPLPGLLAQLHKRGLSGLEGLIGIPGTVGGGVAMNAGSYGCTLGERLLRVQLFSHEKGLIWLGAEQCQAGYRFFDPGLEDGTWVVTRVELELFQADPGKIKESMRQFYFQKKQTQPILSRTCGCVFKNPGPGTYAGRLLEDCGLKGFRCGGMGFSTTHANFLVNHGQGTASEALELIEIARQRCKQSFDRELELEVKVIGTGSSHA